VPAGSRARSRRRLAHDLDNQERDRNQQPERQDACTDVDALVRGNIQRNHVREHDGDREGAAEREDEPDPARAEKERNDLRQEHERRDRKRQVVMPRIHDR
jgi:hypothetical protein